MKFFKEVDEYLGPSDSRFFSSGYKKVSYELSGETVINSNYSASLKLIYPENWSVKNKTNAIRILVALTLC